MALKSIHLHRAAVDNAGNRIEAGNDLKVGDKPGEIAADRAQELLDTLGAITGTEAAKAEPEPKVD
jgi:HrpA-like RNA helicase